ncbi:MAG: PEP-utilizing enzyme [Ardenticatenaceae bacterium]
MSRTRFDSPYELPAPAGAEGWQEMYPYFYTFKENRREEEDAKFWFCDSQHWPTVFKPFDTITIEFSARSLGAYNTRQYLIPPANGIDYRIHNGYLYFSPVAVPPEEIPGRVPHFLERAGYYFANWNELLDNWDKKVANVIEELESITFEPLPEMVPLEWVTSGRGLDSGYDIASAYDRLIQLAHKAWQYHFEFLNLGYAAYLDFFGFCKEAFPDIPDLAIAKMVQGVEVDLFRPDDEVRNLAKLAVELGLSDVIRSGSVDSVLAALADAPNGDQWLAAWEKSKYPWFNFTSGNGFYSSDKYWIEHLDIPMGYVQDYIGRVLAGQDIDRPTEAVRAERDRITEEYAASLTDDETREAFMGKLGLAKTVFPYVENHNFYIEHWSMGVFWRKMRELAQLMTDAGFCHERDDFFYLNRYEVPTAIFDYVSGWAVGAPSTGPTYWPAIIEKRKAQVAALSTQTPAPALNEPPEVITEPFTIMLWGITTDRVQSWLGGDSNDGTLSGMSASPGLVEGRARVIRGPDQLGEIEDGEILVAPITAPSWAPVFARIQATVTDIGGMMSHAAIVCREYGLPAVTGTGSASAVIKTGMMIRVDGTAGEVTILD